MLRASTLFAIIVFAHTFTFGQSKDLDKLQKCQREWKYQDLSKGLNGLIIFYDQPVVMCGVVSTASVAIIKTDSGDTIRVLTMCNTKKDFSSPTAFSTGQSVTITPSEKPRFRIDFMPVDLQSCELNTAYFGLIAKNAK